MKEVIYKAEENNQPVYSKTPCPKCGAFKLVHGTIPCPDGRVGCLVNHYGYRCHNCYTIFQ